MLKLTSSAVGAGTVYVMAAHVVALQRHGAITTVYTTGINFDVRETPEEIMAMPEMVMLLYPSMVVSSAGGFPIPVRYAR